MAKEKEICTFNLATYTIALTMFQITLWVSIGLAQ